MEAEKEEDPFASIIGICRPTASQEAKFRKCPLFGQPENIPDPYLGESSSSPEPTPSEPAEIVMVSPPASASSSLRQTADEDMVFHTPPEHHNHTHLSSSEDELLCAKGVRNRYDVPKKVRVFAGELDGEADSKESRVPIEVFDGDTVPVGETEEIVTETQADKGVVHSAAADDDVLLVVEDSEDSGEEMDESNSNKDLLCAINLGQENCDLMEGEGGGCGVSQGENSSYSNGSLNSSKIEEDIFKLKCTAEGGNGFSEMREEEKAVNEVIENPKDGYSNGGLRKDDGERIGEIDDVSDGDVQKKRTCSRDAGGSSRSKRRKLPTSLDGKDENVADETVEESKEGGLLDFMSILNVIFVGDDKDGACDEDVDFLETAKRRGLTFPRPRWWPPEAEGGDRW